MTTQHSASYTGPTTEELDHIPADLKARPQWVLWRGADSLNQQTGEVKLNKIPIDPQTLTNASTTDPETWGTFDYCVAALPAALEEWQGDDPGAYRGGGIGYVFSYDDPYTGVDLDHCRDPDTGAIADGAQAHINALASYTEVTPSQSGVHILVHGTLPPRGRKKGAVEMYDYARFFTMTEWHLAGTPPTIVARQAELTTFHRSVFGPQQSACQHGPMQASSTPLLEDTVLLDKARTAKRGTRFTALWAGDITGYDSPSNADLALCVRLAFWTQDAAQIDRLFRQSGLMRDKWDEKRGAQTYGERTIAEALARQTEHYRAPGEAQRRRNGTVPGPEPDDPCACPELPAYAQIDAEAAANASLFLGDYIDFSREWAPRAYEGFHEAVGMFVLATTAARRVRIELGGGMYTSLYIALAARTTLYTKTTVADIGLALLHRAGLRYLLADDDATPQALLRTMAGYVDTRYAHMPDLAQVGEQRRLAFSAQRGWFYEEWGQHLDAMMDKRGGIMASFRSILRRLDDHKEEYTYATIGRGRELLSKPYLCLLANVTPADLQPFVRKDSKLWRDGFIARMNFITPPEGTPSEAEFPRGERVIPARLIADLDTWHRKLGIPTCTIEQEYDSKGQPRDAYSVVREALPEITYSLSEEVWNSFYAYDRALRELASQRRAEYLDGSYGRFPVTALRIAALLASLHDDANQRTIWPKYWARGQQIAESWRQGLHQLIKQVHSASPEPTPKRQLEEKLLRQAKQRGPQSLRQFGLNHNSYSREEIEQGVAALVKAGEFITKNTSQTTKYAVPDWETDEV